MIRGEETAARIAPLLFAAATALPAQTAPEKPFVERVEVNVRSVFVVIRGKDGRVPSPAVAADDIEIRVDGTPVRILGVDPIRSAAPRTAEPPPAAPMGEPASPAPAPARITQYLYIDAPMLRIFSVKTLARALSPQIDALAATGPVGIVVADPSPATRLAPTDDAAKLRAAIERLSHDVSGRESLIIARRQAMDDIRPDPRRALKSGRLESAAEQDLQIFRTSLEALRSWAAPLGHGPLVLYFVSDGFDVDASEAYREALGPAAVVGEDGPTLISLQADFATRGARLVAETSQELAALGVTVVPISLGSRLPESSNDASADGSALFRSNQSSGPQFLFARPLEPLQIIAEATGGEVAISRAGLAKIVGENDRAYLVSFRLEEPPGGGVHKLEIASRRAGLTVRGPRVFLEGAPRSVAAGTTVRALRGESVAGNLAVRLALDDVRKGVKASTATLHVTVDFDPFIDVLEMLEKTAKLRVTIAVEVAGARGPFVTYDELDAPRTGEGTLWSYEAPISWPKKGRRVAVTVEELQTGSRGTAGLDLPQ